MESSYLVSGNARHYVGKILHSLTDIYAYRHILGSFFVDNKDCFFLVFNNAG